MKTYSVLIKEIRTSMKLSLREFAEKCLLSHSYIDKLEKGIDPRNNKPVSPTLDTIKQICDKTNYPLESFLAETGYIRYVEKQQKNNTPFSEEKRLLSSSDEKIMNLYNSLSPEQQEKALSYLQFLTQEDRK